MTDNSGFDSRVPRVRGFVVGPCLGVGSSASVWLLTRARDGQRFALRVGPEPEDASATPTAHENILASFGSVKLDWDASATGLPASGRLLELAMGGTLEALLRVEGQLSPGQIVTVAVPLARALSAMHDAGVSHGDVSPANVLFDAEGRPKLADFGEVRVRGSLRRSGPKATNGFVAPEVLRGLAPGESMPAADVYSLCALIWFALTGSPPGELKTRVPLPMLNQAVSSELAELVEAGLSQDSECRPRAAELGRALYRTAPAQPLPISSSAHHVFVSELATIGIDSLRARKARLQRPRRHAKSKPRPGSRRLASARPGVKGSARTLRSPHIRLLGIMAVLVLGLAGGLLWLGRTPVSSAQISAQATGTRDSVNASPEFSSNPEPATSTPGNTAPVTPPTSTPVTPPPAFNTPAAQIMSTDRDEPAIALGRLVQARTDLLGKPAASIQPEELLEIYAPGSPPMIRDRELIGRLRSSGTRYLGFALTLSGVRILAATESDKTVAFEVTAKAPGFTIRHGEPSEKDIDVKPSETKMKITLVDNGRGWRIADVSALT